MAINKFVHAIARGAPITLFGDGSSRRDYTFIDDIVSGVVASIERIEAGRYEIYNLGGTHTVSLQELVEIIERVVGKPAIVDRRPMQPGDVPVTYANVDRARAALGYTPTTPTALGIERYWLWLRSSGRIAID
jgi:UDP-glucuronate 4-epimerase